MSRKSPSKAEEYLKHSESQSFKYGSFDCVLFTRRILERFHGIKLRLPVRYTGTKKSIRENFEALDSRTLEQAIQVFAQSKKWEIVENLNLIQDYDLIIIRHQDKFFCGVWNGQHAITTKDEGLIYLDKSTIHKAFRVKG